MIATIRSVDYAPDDLYAQTPFAAELLHELSGPDRDDYWLARLQRPLRWSQNRIDHTIDHIVLASRYVGETLSGFRGRIVVGITFVTDNAQLSLPAVDMSKCAYVAIGVAEISDPAT